MIRYRFVFVFLGTVVALFTAQLWHPVQDAIVVPWTFLIAKVSAATLMPFDRTVMAVGQVLRDKGTGAAVSIEPGCNGVEACLILIAGILAFPASWRMRAAGISVGVLTIQVFNVMRIITLYYLVRHNKPLFRFAHLYLWQMLIILDALVIWLLWARRVNRQKARLAAAHA